MNTGNDTQAMNHEEWRVSWLAYIPHMLFTIVLLYGLLQATSFHSQLFAVSVIGLTLCFIGYKAYYLSRVRLYVDESGVWVYRGVFPWSRGVYGIKWRDLEDAVYKTGFAYWVAKGYPVILRPRFSNNPHIPLPPIHLGHKAVERINYLARSSGSL